MSKLPETGPSLSRWLRQQERQAGRQASSSAFARSGTRVSAEGVTTVDGTLNVVGALVVDGTETVNGPLAVHGTANFDGNTHIGGALDVDATANFDGNTTIGGTLGVTGPTTLGGATTVSGNTSVSGSLGVTGPLDVHGTAAFDGNTTIGGNAAITGTLSLPSGIVDNDALANPVVPASRWLDASNFGLTTAWVAKVTISVTVPAGFTEVQVVAAGRLVATNSTATKDWLYTKITIGAATQSGFPTGVDTLDTATSVTAFTATLTGLTSGGTVNIVLWGFVANAAWATSAANAADLSVSLLWLR